MKKGKKLEAKLHSWLKELGIYHQRFFDSASQGLVGAARPADYWVWFNGKLIFIECKETQEKSLAFGNIRSSQWKACKEAETNNIIYLFLIEIQKELYIVRGKLLLKWAKHSSKKSINYNIIADLGDLTSNKADLKAFLQDM